MRLIEDKKIAIAVLLICILISIVGMGGSKLTGKADKAMDVFISGTEPEISGTRYSMDAYLDRCSENAVKLSESAKLIPGTDEALIKAVAEIGKELDGAKDLNKRYDAYLALTEGVEKLHTNVMSVAGSSDVTSVSLAYHDYKGAMDLIERDGYHELAKEYNAEASGFPASLIANLWGVGKLNTFGW